MQIPRCLVLIPDGNRTWAKSLGKLTSYGHDKGLIRCREVVEAAFEAGVQHVVFWGMSEANIHRRDPNEIAHLFSLLKKELRYRLARHEQVRFRIIGSWPEYSTDAELKRLVEELEQRSACYEARQFTVLFVYSGKSELRDAFLRAVASGKPVNETAQECLAWTSFLPEVDLIVRTGVKGDPHLSDYLLPLKSGNAQLYFTDIPWPKFGKKELQAALADYARRPRRLGA